MCVHDFMHERAFPFRRVFRCTFRFVSVACSQPMFSPLVQCVSKQFRSHVVLNICPMIYRVQFAALGGQYPAEAEPTREGGERFFIAGLRFESNRHTFNLADCGTNCKQFFLLANPFNCIVRRSAFSQPLSHFVEVFNRSQLIVNFPSLQFRLLI